MGIFGCQLYYAIGFIQYDILVIESNYCLYHGLRFGRRLGLGTHGTLPFTNTAVKRLRVGCLIIFETGWKRCFPARSSSKKCRENDESKLSITSCHKENAMEFLSLYL
jgi:hypothetical protein